MRYFYINQSKIFFILLAKVIIRLIFKENISKPALVEYFKSAESVFVSI